MSRRRRTASAAGTGCAGSGRAASCRFGGRVGRAVAEQGVESAAESRFRRFHASFPFDGRRAVPVRRHSRSRRSGEAERSARNRVGSDRREIRPTVAIVPRRTRAHARKRRFSERTSRQVGLFVFEIRVTIPPVRSRTGTSTGPDAAADRNPTRNADGASRTAPRRRGVVGRTRPHRPRARGVAPRSSLRTIRLSRSQRATRVRPSATARRVRAVVRLPARSCKRCARMEVKRGPILFRCDGTPDRATSRSTSASRWPRRCSGGGGGRTSSATSNRSRWPPSSTAGTTTGSPAETPLGERRRPRTRRSAEVRRAERRGGGGRRATA